MEYSHIDNIISTVSKKISMLRKIKYILDKDLLNKIYLTFIRPTLEYASDLWDNCGVDNSERL